MKKSIALIALFAVLTISNAQLNQSSRDEKLVKIKDWMKTAFSLPEHFWEDNKKDELIKQIGVQEFEKVKIYSQRNFIPCQMQVFCEDLDGSRKKDINLLKKKMNSLKAYKIASYSHWYGGEYWGQYSIIKVPYINNKDWDSTAKWEVVYFIIPEKYTEEVN